MKAHDNILSYISSLKSLPHIEHTLSHLEKHYKTDITTLAQRDIDILEQNFNYHYYKLTVEPYMNQTCLKNDINYELKIPVVNGEIVSFCNQGQLHPMLFRFNDWLKDKTFSISCFEIQKQLEHQKIKKSVIKGELNPITYSFIFDEPEFLIPYLALEKDPLEREAKQIRVFALRSLWAEGLYAFDSFNRYLSALIDKSHEYYQPLGTGVTKENSLISSILCNHLSAFLKHQDYDNFFKFFNQLNPKLQKKTLEKTCRKIFADRYIIDCEVFSSKLSEKHQNFLYQKVFEYTNAPFIHNVPEQKLKNFIKSKDICKLFFSDWSILENFPVFLKQLSLIKETHLIDEINEFIKKEMTIEKFKYRIDRTGSNNLKSGFIVYIPQIITKMINNFPDTSLHFEEVFNHFKSLFNNTVVTEMEFLFLQQQNNKSKNFKNKIL